MNETRTVHDPFLNKTVEIGNKLTDRLRGRYANGPTLPNGEPEFGWREFPTPPIQKEAADRIERLETALRFYAEQWQGNGAGDPETPGLSRTWDEPTDELLSDEGRTARAALSSEHRQK